MNVENPIESEKQSLLAGTDYHKTEEYARERLAKSPLLAILDTDYLLQFQRIHDTVGETKNPTDFSTNQFTTVDSTDSGLGK